MNGTNRTICLSLFLCIVLVAGESFAHNPDGTLTEAELASIAIEQSTIVAMNRTISWALAEVPINWLVIWFAQLVIEEARAEIEAIENHTGRVAHAIDYRAAIAAETRWHRRIG